MKNPGAARLGLMIVVAGAASFSPVGHAAGPQVIQLAGATGPARAATAGPPAPTAGPPARTAASAPTAAHSASTAPTALASGPKPITLDSTEQARLGLATTTLATAKAPSGIATTARVLDPGPLLQLDSELTAAEASLAASRAEAERTRRLFAEDRTASKKAVEAAEAQAQADQQRVYSAQRRLALEWGEGVAGLSPRERSALLNDLARVRAELIRLELPSGTPAPKRGAVVEVRADAESPTVSATVLGSLPTADPRLQTRGVLGELKGPQATLPLGQMLSAEIPLPAAAGSAAGVVLPRSALLRKDSQVWAYVQTAPTTFLRREVIEYRPVLAGWFVSRGFAPGDRVVTAGAEALLGVETPAPQEGGADD
jgi:hypothetical protein